MNSMDHERESRLPSPEDVEGVLAIFPDEQQRDLRSLLVGYREASPEDRREMIVSLDARFVALRTSRART